LRHRELMSTSEDILPKVGMIPDPSGALAKASL